MKILILIATVLFIGFLSLSLWKSYEFNHYAEKVQIYKACLATNQVYETIGNSDIDCLTTYPLP